MSRELSLILGPPGTGKTTTLLDIVERHIAGGVPPSRIAFVTFTKAAATEAASRAAAKFGLTKNQLPHFRTLHSMAFRALCLNHANIMGRNDYAEIAALLGIEFTGYGDADMTAGVLAATDGDAMLQLLGLAHATTRPLREVWEDANTDIDWHRLAQFAGTVESYKQDTAKIDFSDMITNYTQERILCDVDVAIIDEAQDLSNAQWDMAKVAFRGASHVYLAGDDDQAIYEWSGANVERFLSLKAGRRVLPKTYRLPEQIMSVTESIAGRIRRRFKKEYGCANTMCGQVLHHQDVDQLPVGEGTWMMLGRNSRFLDVYEEYCVRHGIPYTTRRGPSVDHEHLTAIRAWVDLQRGKEVDENKHKLIHILAQSAAINTRMDWHDGLRGIPLEAREYYRSILRNGRKLTSCGDVYIGTIHSVKGAEADHVVISQDVTAKTAQGMERNPDAEHRVFYVGASRARKTLHIIAPQTAEFYTI